ncbi:MAG: recombination protein O N-terminal domain-containing protein [Spirochaetaceae bacterium]|jgi:DNA repair protein RecO (recombination protein O)|nr:recombination protein O N-terminal domain-containing protein [Spirochaetaceae bacterium]
MPRSFTYSALVLRVRPSGESNREAWFLTAEEGILKATVFGGPKSRLRAYIAPYHQGTLWLYRDPVRDAGKVTDFDVQSWRPGIRERYERANTASSLIETMLASHAGGGSWTEAMRLAGQALDALDYADPAYCVRILVHFLWNWIDVLGLRQDILRCPACAGESGVLLFNSQEGTLRCPACAGTPAPLIPICLGARRWLTAAGDMNPALLNRYTLDGASLLQAKTLVTGLMSCILGKRLESWDSGG